MRASLLLVLVGAAACRSAPLDVGDAATAPLDAGVCPAAPPGQGAACDVSAVCTWKGSTWAATCACDHVQWSCSLDTCSAIAGNDCGDTPHGYPCVFAVDPNQFQRCVCPAGAWMCAAQNCPPQKPTSGTSCAGMKGTNCQYGPASFCACPGGDNPLWSCDNG